MTPSTLRTRGLASAPDRRRRGDRDRIQQRRANTRREGRQVVSGHPLGTHRPKRPATEGRSVAQPALDLFSTDFCLPFLEQLVVAAFGLNDLVVVRILVLLHLAGAAGSLLGSGRSSTTAGLVKSNANRWSNQCNYTQNSHCPHLQA